MGFECGKNPISTKKGHPNVPTICTKKALHYILYIYVFFFVQQGLNSLKYITWWVVKEGAGYQKKIVYI